MEEGEIEKIFKVGEHTEDELIWRSLISAVVASYWECFGKMKGEKIVLRSVGRSMHVEH